MSSKGYSSGIAMRNDFFGWAKKKCFIEDTKGHYKLKLSDSIYLIKKFNITMINYVWVSGLFLKVRFAAKLNVRMWVKIQLLTNMSLLRVCRFYKRWS